MDSARSAPFVLSESTIVASGPQFFPGHFINPVPEEGIFSSGALRNTEQATEQRDRKEKATALCFQALAELDLSAILGVLAHLQGAAAQASVSGHHFGPPHPAKAGHDHIGGPPGLEAAPPVDHVLASFVSPDRLQRFVQKDETLAIPGMLPAEQPGRTEEEGDNDTPWDGYGRGGTTRGLLTRTPAGVSAVAEHEKVLLRLKEMTRERDVLRKIQENQELELTTLRRTLFTGVTCKLCDVPQHVHMPQHGSTMNPDGTNPQKGLGGTAPGDAANDMTMGGDVGHNQIAGAAATGSQTALGEGGRPMQPMGGDRQGGDGKGEEGMPIQADGGKDGGKPRQPFQMDLKGGGPSDGGKGRKGGGPSAGRNVAPPAGGGGGAGYGRNSAPPAGGGGGAGYVVYIDML